MGRYRIKGYRIFAYVNGGLSYSDYTKEEFNKIFVDNTTSKVDTKELMSGTQFITDVNCNEIGNSDGYIENIYVDGYKTNLGVVSKHLIQGAFLVDFETFGKICLEHDVKVHWISKNH